MRWTGLAICGVFFGAISMLAAAGASGQTASQAPVAMQPGPNVLTYRNGDQVIHAMPTVELARRFRASTTASANNLIYHNGPVMGPAVIYTIFWQPPRLQSGAATPAFPAAYIGRMNSMLSLYHGHPLAVNNTQYYEVSGGKTIHISPQGAFGGTYTDKATPFPARACSDSATPTNCLTDAQLQAEVRKIVALKKWAGGLNHVFMIYTPSGMGSCYASGQCAYTTYCAYHSHYVAGTDFLYGNEPYGTANGCWDGGPSPSGNVAIDSALDTSSHELTEAITDPLGTAWFNNQGAEIGDLCNFTFGVDRYDGGKANQDWNNVFFRIQEEYDNKKSACEQTGP